MQGAPHANQSDSPGHVFIGGSHHIGNLIHNADGQGKRRGDITDFHRVPGGKENAFDGADILIIALGDCLLFEGFRHGCFPF